MTMTKQEPEVKGINIERGRSFESSGETLAKMKWIYIWQLKSLSHLFTPACCSVFACCSLIPESEVAGAAGGAEEDDIPEGLSIAKKTFGGKFAVVADEFEPELVGAKSRNIAGLRGKLPDWINLPTSVALPFGSFDAVLKDPINKVRPPECHKIDCMVSVI